MFTKSVVLALFMCMSQETMAGRVNHLDVQQAPEGDMFLQIAKKGPAADDDSSDSDSSDDDEKEAAAEQEGSHDAVASFAELGDEEKVQALAQALNHASSKNKAKFWGMLAKGLKYLVKKHGHDVVNYINRH